MGFIMIYFMMHLMRIHWGFVFSLGVFLLFSGCKKEEDLPGFDMQYQQEFTMQAGLGAFVTHHFYFKNLPTRYNSLLTQFGKTDEDIKRILPAQAQLVGVFGDADFSVIEEAVLRVYSESDPAGILEVAYRFPTPIDPSNTFDIIPGLADAKKIMSRERFSIDLALRLRNITQDETPVRMSLKFKAVY